MTNQLAIKRVRPLRDAIRRYKFVRDSLEWLQGQLVLTTASSLRSRFNFQLGLILSDDPRGYTIKKRMNRAIARNLDPLSFAAWIMKVRLQDTYLTTGRGALSAESRQKRITKLIKRARDLTLGTSDITWFLLSVAVELKKYMPDDYKVELNLLFDDNDNEVILCQITYIPPKEVMV